MVVFISLPSWHVLTTSSSLLKEAIYKPLEQCLFANTLLIYHPIPEAAFRQAFTNILAISYPLMHAAVCTLVIAERCMECGLCLRMKAQSSERIVFQRRIPMSPSPIGCVPDTFACTLCKISPSSVLTATSVLKKEC